MIARSFHHDDIVGIAGSSAFKSNDYTFFDVDDYSISSFKLHNNMKKDIASYEEYFYYFDFLNFGMCLKQIDHLLKIIDSFEPDAIYSDMNICGIIAAKAAHVPCYTSYNYTIEANNKKFEKAILAINKILIHYQLEQIINFYDLFNTCAHRFIFNSFTNEPVKSENTTFCGIDNSLVSSDYGKTILIDLTYSALSEAKQISIIKNTFLDSPYKVEMVTAKKHQQIKNIHLSSAITKQSVLENACAFIHDGSDVNTELMIRYQVPGIVITSNFMKYRMNSNILLKNNCAFKLSEETFCVKCLYESFRALLDNMKYRENIQKMSMEFNSYEGSKTVSDKIRKDYLNTHE